MQSHVPPCIPTSQSFYRQESRGSVPIHSQVGAVSRSGPVILFSDAIKSFLVSQDWQQCSSLDRWSASSLP